MREPSHQAQWLAIETPNAWNRICKKPDLTWQSIEKQERFHTMSSKRHILTYWVTNGLAGFTLLVAAPGCSKGSKEINLSTAQGVPAATAKVKANQGDSGNTEVELNVTRLAPPQKIDPKTNTFVVWAEPLDASIPPQNMGALTLDENLSGQMRSSTSHQKFRLFVTAEPAATVPKPTGSRLLWTDIVMTG